MNKKRPLQKYKLDGRVIKLEKKWKMKNKKNMNKKRLLQKYKQDGKVIKQEKICKIKMIKFNLKNKMNSISPI